MMTLKQLRYLVALADTLHFHKAAEQCHISQPTLSNQIRELEQGLGVELFERTKRRVLPTPVGKAVIARARKVLRETQDIADLARHAQRPLAGPLRLGVIPTLGPYLLPHVLPALRARYPDLKLYLREDQTPRLLRRLREGELDVLLITLPGSAEDLEVLDLFREPFWVALPHDHPLAAREELGPSDLAGEELILLEEGHCLRDQALSWCRRVGASEEMDFQATSLDTLRQMVASHIGITVLPALYVTAEAAHDPHLAMRRFADPAPGRLIALVWRRRSARREEFVRLGRFIHDRLPTAVDAAPLAEPGLAESGPAEPGLAESGRAAHMDV